MRLRLDEDTQAKMLIHLMRKGFFLWQRIRFQFVDNAGDSRFYAE